MLSVIYIIWEMLAWLLWNVQSDESDNLRDQRSIDAALDDFIAVYTKK